MTEAAWGLGQLVVVGRVDGWHVARAPWADVTAQGATHDQAVERVREAVDLRYRAAPVSAVPDEQVVVSVQATIRPVSERDVLQASGPEVQQALRRLGFEVRGRTRFHATLSDPARGRTVVVPLEVELASPTMFDVLRQAAVLADELASVL